jgi:hypothetical protein
MKQHYEDSFHQSKKKKIIDKYPIFIAALSLIWFVFRTGTKPSRVTYPCQRAALANSSVLLGLSISLWLSSALIKTKKFLNKQTITMLIILIIANIGLSSTQFTGGLELAKAADPNQELLLSLEPMQASFSPASNLYVVNGQSFAHVNELVNLMSSNNLFFYKSDTTGENQASNGLIANNDVILIKINEEWPYRGGTNTDVLKELIQALVDHPDGFIGEIVVADNGQWQGNMDWPESNAQDIYQSTQDVVNLFSASYKVSTYSWIPLRQTQVDEYQTGDMTDGYILYNKADPQTGIYVSYPKFKTQFGTNISFKNGIWNGTAYEKRLKVINLPVLKTHMAYGVTASLKHYMGVQSQGEWQPGLSNGHSTIATGGMGTLMVETGLPTLNIIDALWINANPSPYSGRGPSTPYNQATQVNVLMASTDPVALDYWAAKHVLMQTANLIGYTDTHTINPDSTDGSGVDREAFGVWLKLTENEIANAGYSVTSQENKMNVYITSETPTSTPTPSPTVTPTPTPFTPTPTHTSSPSPPISPTPSPTPQPTQLHSPTPEPTPDAGFNLPLEYIAIGIIAMTSGAIVVLLLRRK